MTAHTDPVEDDSNIAPLCQLFAIAENPADYTKSYTVLLTAQCSARDLNSLILDLDREREWHRRRNYELSTLIGTITDELRKRAEKLENNQ